MLRKFICLSAAILLMLPGCAKEKRPSQTELPLSESFQTTARVKYKELDAVMTILRQPMNCAIVQFESPKSLQNLQVSFDTEKVTVSYQDLSFDFSPDSMPTQAAAKLVVSAVNAALEGSGITVTQNESQLTVAGTLNEGGSFSLVLDRKNGNIVKLTIPESQLEMEVLNFKILE